MFYVGRNWISLGYIFSVFVFFVMSIVLLGRSLGDPQNLSELAPALAVLMSTFGLLILGKFLIRTIFYLNVAYISFLLMLAVLVLPLFDVFDFIHLPIQFDQYGVEKGSLKLTLSSVGVLLILWFRQRINDVNSFSRKMVNDLHERREHLEALKRELDLNAKKLREGACRRTNFRRAEKAYESNLIKPKYLNPFYPNDRLRELNETLSVCLPYARHICECSDYQIAKLIVLLEKLSDSTAELLESLPEDQERISRNVTGNVKVSRGRIFS